ncbi:M67 family metallopeptidase [Zavarzinella formosa]|uniref:M67 family metallopeptidase n=1 Tax=Zavarzinella formosa TaxID=360055 RepID=UPI0012F7E7F6|nr:M67 family metallopeptidase [Zavarzinella formosa]
MPTRPRIRIPDLLLAELIAHAAQEHPLECCGLLAGIVTPGACEVTVRIPLTNHLKREDEFESDPAEMLAAHRRMRREGLEMLAVYHSHPASEPVPSRKDRLRSIDERVACVIVGPTGDVRMWWLLSAHEQTEANWETK